MLKLKIRILILFMFVSLYGNSQINWFMMTQALGQDSVVITNANGFGEWKPKSDLGFLEMSDTLSTLATQYDLTLVGGGTDDQTITIDSTGRYFGINLEDGGRVSFIDTDTQLSEEQVEDYVGGMVTGGTETGISVTYTDGGVGAGVLNFVTTDQSLSNEGSLSVGAGGANTSTIVSNTSGGTPVTISGGTNVTVTEAGSTITIAASGGATPTLDAVLTAGASSNTAFESGDITINGDVTPRLTLSGTSNLITFDDTDGGDWSLYNDQTDFLFYSASAGVKFEIQDYNMGYIKGFEYQPDAAALRLYASDDDETIELRSTTSGAVIEIAGDDGAAGQVLTSDGTYTSWGTTDQSISNEGSLTVAAGSSTTSVINSNTSGSTGVTITAGTGLEISEVGNVITLADAVSSGNGTSSAISTPTSATWTPIDIETVTFETGDVNIVEASDYITLSSNGYYMLTYSGYCSASTSTWMGIKAFRDGGNLQNEVRLNVPSTSTYVPFASSILIYVSTAPDNITINTRDDAANPVSIDAIQFNIFKL